MKRLLWYTCLLFVATLSAHGHAQASAAAPVTSDAPDYSAAANWVCRPGAEEICTSGLDAVVVSPDGHKVAQPFVPAKDPAIDCFYVYPTVSLEKTDVADMTDSPEIQRAVKSQVGRLSSRCRIFAPVYRQATLFGLRRMLAGTGEPRPFAQALLDVETAWAYYLQHDNHGRGVVLVAHSQGTLLVKQLIAKSIDGKPAEALLVSAFLAGETSLGVPPGKVAGGDFKHVPVCTAAAQTGCVYVWGSYLADDPTQKPFYGRIRTDGMVSACAIPAAPSGGPGMLKFYRTNQSESGPPWIEAVQQFSGECRADASGPSFRVTVLPGPMADADLALLKKSYFLPDWGLHVQDIALLQGNMLDVLDAEIAAWRKAH